MKQTTISVLLILLAALLLVACGPGGETAVDHHEPAHTEVEEHDRDHDHDDDHDSHSDSHGASHDHDHDHGPRIPNNSAVVRITAPADGETFARDEQIILEIETENFAPGEDGNHWHIYVNDESWGKVGGANYSEVLRGLPPGAHEISVYLSIATHEELEDGDTVTITITD
jgi:hypothetical protein